MAPLIRLPAMVAIEILNFGFVRDELVAMEIVAMEILYLEMNWLPWNWLL